jgi:hypothetical protein
MVNVGYTGLRTAVSGHPQMRQGVSTAYANAVSSSVLVCVTLTSGAMLGMAAQSGLFHLGLDFGSVRDDLIVGQIAHSRSALAWWAWWLVPPAAFFIGPLSVALTRWLLANWWLFRAVRLVATAAIVLVLAAIGELPAASTTLDVRSGAAAGMLVVVLSALLAWLGARILGAARRKPAPALAASARRQLLARPPEQIRLRVPAPIPAPVPWRGGGSADAGAPFVRVRQPHSLVARFTLARLALVGMLALVVFAGVAALSSVIVLVEQTTPDALRQLAVRSGLPLPAPASTAQDDGMAVATPSPARAEPAGMVVDGVLIPESELTFAKGYAKRQAAITAAQRQSARIVAAAEKAENRRPRHVAALRPVRYGHARRHVAYVRHAEPHAPASRRYMGERQQAPRHPDRAHDPRRLRGHDRYARLEPHARILNF